MKKIFALTVGTLLGLTTINSFAEKVTTATPTPTSATSDHGEQQGGASNQKVYPESHIQCGYTILGSDSQFNKCSINPPAKPATPATPASPGY